MEGAEWRKWVVYICREREMCLFPTKKVASWTI